MRKTKEILSILKCCILVVAILAAVSCYGIYAFTNPHVNGVALSAVIGGITIMAAMAWNKVKELQNRFK